MMSSLYDNGRNMFAVAEVTQASPPTATRQFLTFSHSTFATGALVVSSRFDYLAFFLEID